MVEQIIQVLNAATAFLDFPEDPFALEQQEIQKALEKKKEKEK